MKLIKPYVTDAIFEVFVRRAKLIKIKYREEKQVKRFDRQRVFAVWREATHWVAGHRRPTHVALDTFGDSNLASTTPSRAPMLTKGSRHKRSKQIPKQEKPRLP